MTILFRIYFIAFLLLLAAGNGFAQIQLSTPKPVSPKAIKRYEIDAKRIGSSMNSEDALPRSREFIRLDSTYYVGWLYEGFYKFNHAADYTGYRNAAVPLDRAFHLLEHDFSKELRTRTTELVNYIQVYKYQAEYSLIASLLVQCYMNMEKPVEAMTILRRVLSWNMQRDYLDVYNQMAWNVHRNRFYTSEKFPFLKNSIDENEALAAAYLDSAMRKIEKDKQVNAHIFQPGYEQNDKLGVYYYKSVLYAYALNIDSAMYYFNKLRNTSIFPHNNYGNFRMVCGDFREAEKQYREASETDNNLHQLREYLYFTAMLDVYKGKPKEGIELMKETIKFNGSTPGFGWYNIGLARSMYYDGEIAESKRYIDKAEQFKELHIGTTLGQSHYDFSVQLNKLMNKEAEFEMERFENSNWWYNPKVLGNMAQLTAEKYLQQFLIINQFAQNPERDRVVYKLFSTESTVTWDEIWYLVRDFSTKFFIDKFEKEAKADKRRYILKYFRLFVARLQMKQGHYREARALLNAIQAEQGTDLEYEKLFIARVFEAQSACARALDDNASADDYLYRLYTEYPQLVPFTGLKPNMVLHVAAANTDGERAVADRLRDCNINWVDASMPAPEAYVAFSRKGNTQTISYYVLDESGNYIVPRQSFSYKNEADAGISLAYRLFNIGGKMPETEKETEKDAGI